MVDKPIHLMNFKIYILINFNIQAIFGYQPDGVSCFLKNEITGKDGVLLVLAFY